jgi:hypothetical protein
MSDEPHKRSLIRFSSHLVAIVEGIDVFGVGNHFWFVQSINLGGPDDCCGHYVGYTTQDSKFSISISWVLNCRAILIPSTATRPEERGQRNGLDQDFAG